MPVRLPEIPCPAAPLWSDATTDRSTTFASGVGEPQTGTQFCDEVGRGRKSVGTTGRKGADAVLGVLRRGQNDPSRGPWKHPALKARLDLGFSCARAYIAERVKTEILVIISRNAFLAMYSRRAT